MGAYIESASLVHYLWMYPIEKQLNKCNFFSFLKNVYFFVTYNVFSFFCYLGKLKSYVLNKVKPKGLLAILWLYGPRGSASRN